jgi:hypothetical protein
MLELLTWVGSGSRAYDEAIAAWGSHCPRLTTRDDAMIHGLIRRELGPGGPVVVLTPRGREMLES